MKNLLHGLSFFFILFPFSSYAQFPQMGNQKFDTTIVKTWDNGTWVNQSRSFNTYSTDCILNSTTFQSWQNSAWLNSTQMTFTYLPSKKVSQTLLYSWTDPSWVLFGRKTNTYNAALQLTKDLTELYFSNIWMGSSQNFYTYDGNGYLITQIVQSWNGTQFQNSTRTDYTNAAGGLIISDRTQSWSGSAWVNKDSSHYEYNGKNQITSSISFNWAVNQWVNSDRSTYTYVNNLLTQELDQNWINNAWVNTGRITLTYDNFERLKSLLEQTWDVPTQNWINSSLEEFSYTASCGALPLTLISFDADVKSGDVHLQWKTTNEINTSGFMIQKSTDAVHFNTIGNVPSTGGKTINQYSFEDIILNDQTGILYYRLLMKDIDGKSTLSDIKRVDINSRGSLAFFPNPVKDQIIFVLPKTLLNADVRIINQSGSPVLIQKFGNITGGTRNTIDVSVLPKGMYMIQISDGNTISTKKFLKE